MIKCISPPNNATTHPHQKLIPHPNKTLARFPSQNSKSKTDKFGRNPVRSSNTCRYLTQSPRPLNANTSGKSLFFGKIRPRKSVQSFPSYSSTKRSVTEYRPSIPNIPQTHS
jgi:hypothetical protein